MAQKLMVWDDVLGRPVVSTVELGAQGGFELIADEFTIATAGQTVFPVAQSITESEVLIDVYVNGRLVREGGSNDYTVDYVTDEVTFNNPLAENALVLVRVFTEAIIEFNYDVGVGGQSVFSATGLTAEQTVDVWVNGRLVREGGSNDYARDIGNEEIDFNYTVPENAHVRIRLHS